MKYKLNKLNEDNPGWLTHNEGGQDHYYFTDEGDFIVALCGTVKSNKQADTWEIESTKNQCKACLSKINKLEKEGEIEVSMKGIFL